ncbi:MAG: sulfotransferase [Pseudomonadota bacterium]
MSDTPRIFLLGPNKCGTTSFHRLFEASGIPSIHWKCSRTDRFLAHVMITNVSLGRNPIAGLEEYVAFSDMNFASNQIWIEAKCFFREMHKHNQDAYFILNTRDEDDWLLSRSKHQVWKRPNFKKLLSKEKIGSWDRVKRTIAQRIKQANTKRRLRGSTNDFVTTPSWIDRAMKAVGTSNAEEIMELWRLDFRRHNADVADYFSGHPKFLTFNIDSDHISDVSDFLSPDFSINKTAWKHHNRTS